VKLTFPELLTNAAMLDVPAGVDTASTDVSTSTSASDTAADTSSTFSAAVALPCVTWLGATTAFAPVYAHAAPASLPGHVTPPKSDTPAAAPVPVSVTASPYVAAHAITR
jgi:hypothetical protein